MSLADCMGLVSVQTEWLLTAEVWKSVYLKCRTIILSGNTFFFFFKFYLKKTLHSVSSGREDRKLEGWPE